jgi:siderophore synthetase component
MTFELKHGENALSLSVNNKSMRMALASVQSMGFDVRNLDVFTQSEFMMEYAYSSYVVQCRLDRKPVAFNVVEFEDIITAEVEEKSSNLPELFEELANSLVSTVEKQQKKTKGKVKPTMN